MQETIYFCSYFNRTALCLRLIYHIRFGDHVAIPFFDTWMDLSSMWKQSQITAVDYWHIYLFTVY